MTGDWRVSDQDRAQAVEALGGHYAAGRLDASEFDERSDRALAARFHGDLAALFGDLPPEPPAELAPRPVAGRGPRSGFRWPTALVVLLPLAVVLHAWWLVWLPLLFVGVRRARWAHEVRRQTSGSPLASRGSWA